MVADIERINYLTNLPVRIRSGENRHGQLTSSVDF